MTFAHDVFTLEPLGKNAGDKPVSFCRWNKFFRFLMASLYSGLKVSSISISFVSIHLMVFLLLQNQG